MKHWILFLITTVQWILVSISLKIEKYFKDPMYCSLAYFVREILSRSFNHYNTSIVFDEKSDTLILDDDSIQ